MKSTNLPFAVWLKGDAKRGDEATKTSRGQIRTNGDTKVESKDGFMIDLKRYVLINCKIMPVIHQKVGE